MSNVHLDSVRFYLEGLASLFLHRRVAPHHLDWLLQRCPPVEVPSGTVVVAQGDPSDSALMVISGRLRVLVSTPEGTRIVGELGAWDLLGETALFAPDQPRSATVMATQDSACLIFGREVLDEGRDNPVVAALEYHLLHALAQRLRATNLALQDTWHDMQSSEIVTRGREA